MEKSLRDFKKLLQQKIKEGVPVQNEWGVIKAVDWDKKTATVKVNELDYYDVLLGLGFMRIKPSVGSRCLIGIIENAEGCLLIDVDKVEEFEIVSAKSTITLDNKGIDIKTNGESLFDLIRDLIKELGAIQVLPGYGTHANPVNITAFKKRLNTISNG